jgi:hypothetical protein
LFEISLADPLTMTIILALFNPYINITSQSSFQLLFLLLYISLFVVYTVNFPVVRPQSYRVIYYFDTPTFGRKHQLFDRVKERSNFLIVKPKSKSLRFSELQD